MPHVRPIELRIGDLTIEGGSRAGDESWFRVHPPGLALDTGRGAMQLAGANDVFLSHGHLDHALGLPYVLSQRSLHHAEHTRVFCPEETAEDLRLLVTAAERLERTHYRYDIIPMKAGDRVSVGKDLAMQAFTVDHVVPSLGYHLFRGRRRLAPEYAGLPPEELIALRRQGVDPSEQVEEVALTYCGDTSPAVFDLEPRIFDSKVLMLECTFLGEEHRDKGERFKHLHIGDIAAQADRFRNQALVLHHLSRRHSVAQLRAEVERRMPELAPRVHLLVEAED